MFSFFKKKKAPQYGCMVWVERQYADKALYHQCLGHKDLLLCSFFDDTIEKWANYLEKANIAHEVATAVPALSAYRPGILLAKAQLLAKAAQIGNCSQVIFLDLHLSYQALAGAIMHINEIAPYIPVKAYCSLDEPIFPADVQASISRMMVAVGVHEEEAVEHNLVKNAIERMLQRNDERQPKPIDAHSMQEWLAKQGWA